MTTAPVLDITHFTDLACPFASFPSEPTRALLRGSDQLRWRLRMIVLTFEPGGGGEVLSRGAPA